MVTRNNLANYTDIEAETAAINTAVNVKNNTATNIKTCFNCELTRLAVPEESSFSPNIKFDSVAGVAMAN